MCKFKGCRRKVKAKKHCSGHYEQLRLGKKLKALIGKRLVPKKCKFKGCPNGAQGKYCSSHYWQLKKWGMMKPLRKIAPVGSGNITKDGYRKLYKPDHPNASKFGIIGEHRLVMSEILGRPLKNKEEVHHRNGQRADNDRKNLELWSTSHPKGQRVIDLVEWAKEILKQYEPELAKLRSAH